MKTAVPAAIAAAVLCASAFAHERITIGPGGGRVVALDSPSTPNAEFNVRDDKFVITLLDRARKPIAAGEQALTATAGDRSSPQKLAVEKMEGAFVVGPKPPGEDYWVILQLRETPKAKALTFRVHYQAEVCDECSKPEWLCVCGNKTSGENIGVPASLDGLFAEINQHYGELKDHTTDKKYEAIDEVTQALTVLLKALPAKSGENAAAVQPQVDALVAGLAAIADANASRTLSAAANNLETFNTTLAALKKNYPAKIADAKLP